MTEKLRLVGPRRNTPTALNHNTIDALNTSVSARSNAFDHLQHRWLHAKQLGRQWVHEHATHQEIIALKAMLLADDPTVYDWAILKRRYRLDEWAPASETLRARANTLATKFVEGALEGWKALQPTARLFDRRIRDLLG